MSTDRPVIGFDLGHGETALALAYVNANDAPKVIDLPGASRRQHVTAVALAADGRVLIGEEAVRADEVLRLWLAFKSRELDHQDTRKPMRLLVERIVADLVDNGTIPDASGVRWVFGAPSGWTSKHHSAYEELLAEAGLADSQVVAESRAALLYARDSGEVNVMGQRIKQRVLIVDIGSSTTDYTYVTELAQRPVDHGNVELGAALIDKEIMRRAMARHPQKAELEAQLARDPHTTRKLELACRESKEKFFRTRREELAASGKRIGTYHPVELASGEELVVDVRLSVAEMDAVLEAPQPTLNGRSWLQAFAEDVESAVEQAAGAVDLVLLTGGPSRMPFVLDVCRKLVGSDRVALGNEPEVAIARGLALAGRMSVRTEGFRRDVDAARSKIAPLVKEKIPELARAVAHAVADGMTEQHVVPAFNAWRNGHITTLDRMKQRVCDGVRADLEGGGSTVTKAAVDWQNTLRAELDTITRPICNRWHIEPGALRLQPVSIKPGTRVDVAIDTRSMTRDLDNAVNAVNAVVAGVVAMTLFGAGTALLAATGPVFVLFAALGGWGALNAIKDNMMEKVGSANIPKTARRFRSDATLAKLRSGATTAETALAEQLAQALEAEFSNSLAKQVAEEIGKQLDAVADEAELLIR
jgi:hypothetical protein